MNPDSSAAPISAPAQRRPVRVIVVSAALALVLVGVAAWAALFFLQRPAAPTSGLTRIGTYQQFGGGNPAALATLETPEGDWGVEIAGMWSGSRIVDGELGLVVEITRLSPAPEAGIKYSLPGLNEGDSVQIGPIILEVVAIHDAWLDRNDAADVRLSLDDADAGTGLPPPDEITITRAPSEEGLQR